jgi:hypothetical protein
MSLGERVRAAAEPHTRDPPLRITSTSNPITAG